MSKLLTHQQFITRLSKCSDIYKNGNLVILEKYKGKDELILCKDNYGLIYSRPNNLFKNKTPSIKSALDKTNYFINKGKELHNNINYDYSLVNYINSNTKVEIIDPKYGNFKITPSHFLQGKTNRKRSTYKTSKARIISKKQILNRLFLVHKNKYKYNLNDYKNTNSLVEITCNHHGVFKQKIRKHLEGHGCNKCKIENTGWSYTAWKKAGEKSKHFDAYKVYIIKCFDKLTKESFYKIGKTFNKINVRFKTNKELPYDYQIIKIYKNPCAFYISKLENKLKRLNKNNSYLPKKDFGGKHECFKNILMLDENPVLN